MNKFLVYALPVIATGFLYSCTSDIESAEDILGKASSSSEQGISSGNPPPSSSSTSMPSGSVMCVVSGTCAELHADVCSALSGIVVQSCPASSSSSASPSSSSPAPPSSSGVVPSSSSAGQSSSSALPSSSGVVVSSSSPNSGASSSSFVSQNGVVYGTSITYEGETYQTVVIGTQTWMAENLDYTVAGSKCYNNNPDNCDKYGQLYDWATAMNLPSSCNSSTCSGQIQSPHRGICPSGWHIPSNADWDKLYRYADGTSGTSSPYDSPTAGKHLKAQSGWNPYSGIENLDTYGFSALPGGGVGSDGSFYYVGKYGFWWSASEYENKSNYAYSRSMYYHVDDASRDINYKSNLFSVRCLKD